MNIKAAYGIIGILKPEICKKVPKKYRQDKEPLLTKYKIKQLDALTRSRHGVISDIVRRRPNF